jgi:hypothetical protein
MRWTKSLLPMTTMFTKELQNIVYATNTIDTGCLDLCAATTECTTSSQSSYCKDWQDVPVCYGFYWRDIAQTDPCYAPNDPTCPQTFPIVCPDLTTSTPIPIDTCQINCLVTPLCAFNPKHQGSYCKTDMIIPICFGLYWKDPAQTIPCFAPMDPSCPETDPIKCG